MSNVYNEEMYTRHDDLQNVEKAGIPSSEFEKNGKSNYLRDSGRVFKLISDEYLKDFSKLRGGEK
jgi:hypothetical protein